MILLMIQNVAINRNKYAYNKNVSDNNDSNGDNMLIIKMLIILVIEIV